jgi:hypothetical protein
MTSSVPSVRPPVGRSLTILSLAAVAFSLMQTAVVPAIGDMASALHTDAQAATWTLTGYLVSAAVLTRAMSIGPSAASKPARPTPSAMKREHST